MKTFINILMILVGAAIILLFATNNQCPDYQGILYNQKTIIATQQVILLQLRNGNTYTEAKRVFYDVSSDIPDEDQSNLRKEK